MMKAACPQENQQYILDCLELIRENNKDFNISAHIIEYFDDNNIRWEI